MKDKIISTLFNLTILACIAGAFITNPYFNLIDLISIPGWRTISESEKLDKCVSWEKEIAMDLGIEDIPEIIVKSNNDSDIQSVSYGTYHTGDNTISIYMDNLDDIVSAYETICHEMRHCYQRQEAQSGSEIGLRYADNFNNYIKYQDDYEGYSNQLVEKDAIDYSKLMVSDHFFELF